MSWHPESKRQLYVGLHGKACHIMVMELKVLIKNLMLQLIHTTLLKFSFNIKKSNFGNFVSKIIFFCFLTNSEIVSP